MQHIPRPRIWTLRPRAKAPSHARIRRIKWIVGRVIGSALRSAFLGLVLLAPAASDAATSAKPSTAPEPRISGQVTFLYYGDLAAPRKFYGQTLGLVPYLENDWVTLYRTASGATVGLVKAPNSRTSAATKRSVVMVSLVTDDVEAWYRKLRRDGGVRIVKPLYDHPAVPIRAFEIEDPAGYPIEFFQWLDPAEAKSAPTRR